MINRKARCRLIPGLIQGLIIPFLLLPPQSLHELGKLLSCGRETEMVNYILLYKIRKRVKKILKDKISDGELATTKTSCLGCLADDISWAVYYLLKEKEGEG